MAGVITKALRLLAAQLRLLRLDTANTHLRLLSLSLSGGAGIRSVPLACVCLLAICGA